MVHVRIVSLEPHSPGTCAATPAAPLTDRRTQIQLLKPSRLSRAIPTTQHNWSIRAGDGEPHWEAEQAVPALSLRGHRLSVLFLSASSCDRQVFFACGLKHLEASHEGSKVCVEEEALAAWQGRKEAEQPQGDPLRCPAACTALPGGSQLTGEGARGSGHAEGPVFPLCFSLLREHSIDGTGWAPTRTLKVRVGALVTVLPGGQGKQHSAGSGPGGRVERRQMWAWTGARTHWQLP